MTKKERQELVRHAQYPYTINSFRESGEPVHSPHSYIQTGEDERMFVEHANPKLEYEIRRD